MATTKGGIIKAQNENNKVEAVETAKAKGVAGIMNELLDREGIRSRIQELLGKRTPQFMGSLVSLVNATPALKQAFNDSPMTIIQAGLKAATYDLPVDQSLGYAYIVPFNNHGKMEAQFILGYRGMYQMAMRTGVYTKLNVIDIREGELIRWNPLTEDIDLEFIKDEQERESKPVIGYCGFFRLANGMEKHIYWSIEKIKAHEKKHRKGTRINPVWENNFDAMCKKTLIRELIGKWGIMSIDYRTAAPDTLAFAENIARGNVDDELETIDTEALDGNMTVNTETGEIFSADDIKAAAEGE